MQINGIAYFNLRKQTSISVMGQWMPSYEEVLDHADRDDLGSLEFNRSEFSKDEYNTLLNKLTSYTRKHLTTKSIAEYVLSRLPYSVKKILFVSAPKRSVKIGRNIL